MHGRKVRFSVSFRPILAATEDAAWARAERILEETRRLRVAQGYARGGPQQSVGAQRLLAAAGKGSRVDKRLWTAIAQETGGPFEHHRTGRHARTGGRGAARLLRPRRHDLPDPRFRSARRCHRLRPRADTAHARARRRARPQSGLSCCDRWRRPTQQDRRRANSGSPKGSAGSLVRDLGGSRRERLFINPREYHREPSPASSKRGHVAPPVAARRGRRSHRLAGRHRGVRAPSPHRAS